MKPRDFCTRERPKGQVCFSLTSLIPPGPPPPSASSTPQNYLPCQCKGHRWQPTWSPCGIEPNTKPESWASLQPTHDSRCAPPDRNRMSTWVTGRRVKIDPRGAHPAPESPNPCSQTTSAGAPDDMVPVVVLRTRIARVRTLDRRLVERTGSNRPPREGTKRATTRDMNWSQLKVDFSR